MIILYTQDNEPFSIGSNFEDALQAAVVKQTASTRQTIKSYDRYPIVTISWNDGSLTLTAKEVKYEQKVL